MKEELYERSILYNIEPVGMNTVHIESFTSYLTRISFEHNILLGHLVSKVIIPQINKEYLVRSSLYGGNRFYDSAKTINGYMEISENFVATMKRLTGRTDLNCLTMAKWKGSVPLRNLLNDSLKWCPECINTWYSNGINIYYPLIWHIKAVKICSEHGRFLVDICQSCKAKVAILRRQIINGYCTNCFHLLNKDMNRQVPSDEEMKFQNFIIKNVDFLLNHSKVGYPVKNLKEILSNHLNGISGKLENLNNFSKRVNFPTSTLHGWINGKNIPTLENMLLIFFKLNKNLDNSLLEHGKLGIEINNMEIVRKSKKAYTSLNLDLIEKKFKKYLLEEPPLSMTKVAKEIGHDRRVLYSNFPEYCKQISKRYSVNNKEKADERIESLKEEIKKAFYLLKNDHIYPSGRRIEQIANKKGLLKERVLQEYWKRLLTKCDYSD